MQRVMVSNSVERNASRRLLTAIFRSRLFPIVFQIAGLVIYVGLIWFSLGVSAPDGVNPMKVAQTTMTTLVVWGIWLPLLLIVTIFFGRIWCSVCPLELVQQVGDHLGRTLFGKPLNLPLSLHNGVVGVVIYGFLIFALLATRFPREPGNTATLLTALLVVSLVSGMLLGNRMFCKAFCPANVLLGALGRRGMLRIRHGLPGAPNHTCNGGSPVSVKNCPSHLNPKRLKDSSPCTLCGQCVKSSNEVCPVLRPMPAVPNDIWKDYGWAVTVLGFILTGFVIEHGLHDWHTGHEYYMMLPNTTKKAIGVNELSGLIYGIWAMLIVPGALWMAAGVVGKLFNRSVTIPDVWKRISLPGVTILTGIQIVLSVKKFSHWVTHARPAFDKLKDRVLTNPIPDAVYLFKFPARGYGHAPEEHLFSEMVFVVLSIVVLVMCSVFLWKEIRQSKECPRS